MTYPEAIKYLESFIDYEKAPAFAYKESLKLERIKNFLDSIGNPHDGLKCLHIAGTKGKGSTSAFLTYILREAGYKVGLYTSPHLSDFRERIRILGPQRLPGDFEGMISRRDLARLVKRSKPVIERFNARSEYGPLTFFEVYTALAFIYFKENRVDFAVFETGLGGRLDATNIVQPLVCVITPISYEHTQKLGRTLREIAGEKAGIIKKGVNVISAPQDEEASSIIRHKCQEMGVRLREVSKVVYLGLKLRLIGRHQLINAAVAASAIKELQGLGVKVSAAAIKKGLYNTCWPGRCEVISKNPFTVLDGAQNTASAGVLKEAIKENFKYKRLVLVLGISSDKDIKGMCRQLYGLADKIILTKANSPRATAPEKLAGYFRGKEPYLTQGVKEAKTLAQRLAKKEDLVLVTGSLFVVGEFRHASK
jgi:dihydrofolate synthase/folylpolyglutamate synthase